MSCGIGPGSSHHAACDCREAEFALNLREAEARAERLEKALRLVLTDYRTEGCGDPTCAVCARSAAAKAEARAALLPPPEPATVECPDCHGMGRWPNRWPDGHIVFDSDGEPEHIPCERCARSGRVLPPPEPAGGEVPRG